MVKKFFRFLLTLYNKIGMIQVGKDLKKGKNIMEKLKKLRNKKGSISLFVLLSLLFFLVLVTSVSTSRKNKEIIINQQYIRVKENYEREIGTEEQIYARKEKRFILEIDPNGGTYNNSTSTISISQKTGTQLQIENPTAPSIVFDVNGGVIGEVEESISFQNWILSGDGTLNGNIYTFGKSRATLTAKYNKNSIKLPTITKKGYIFNGWYAPNEEKAGNAGEYYSPKGAVTLKAKWTELNKNEVILAFKDSEGTQYGDPNPLILHEGETGTVKAPTIRNYGDWTSLYWTKGTDADSAKDVESGAEIENLDMNSSSNYYARYEKEITVNFNLNGLEGETPSEQKGIVQVNASNLDSIKGLEITIPTIANIDGHTINGWNTKEDGTGTSYNFGEKKEFSDNTTLYAQWKANGYDVIYKRNGLPKGYQEVEYIESTEGQYIDTGYFATDKTKIEVKYKMQLNNAAIFGARKMEGGNTSNNIVNAYMLIDASSLNNNIYHYYGNSYQQSTEAIDPEKIYEATIENGKATISDMTDIQVATQDAFTMEYSMYLFALNENNEVKFSKEGTRIYYFRIYENGNLQKYFVPCYRISDDVIGLYDIVNDQFYTNSGTGTFTKGNNVGVDGNVSIDGTMQNQHFIYNTAQSLTENTYTKQGYIFNGWNTKYDGTGTAYTDGQEVNNLTTDNNGKVTLFAQWTGNSYTVKFDANGGEGAMADQSFTYGTVQNLTANSFIRTGYTFKGWNIAADGSGTAYTDGQEVNNLATSGEITLYAQWTKNQYTVSFNPNRNILLSEYTEVGYLGTDGNQYINLGHAHPISSNTKVEIGAEFGHSYIYGYTGGDGKRYAGIPYSIYTGSATASWTGDTAYHDYVFDHSSGATIDGNTYSLTGTPSGSSGTRDIYLFRALNSTVFVEGKIYYYKQYEGNTLVYDLVPCYRNSDNVSGMYDMVSNTFFTNAGTGSFTTGYRTQQFEYDTAQKLISNSITKTGNTFNGWNTSADGSGTAYEDKQEVNNLTDENNGTVNLYAQWKATEYDVIFSPNSGILPSEYSELEYIESQNYAYILTGVMSDNNYLKFDVQYAVTKLPTSYYMVFGSYKDEPSNTTRLLWGANGTIVYGYVNNKANSYATKDNTRRTINTIYTETLERNDNTIKYTSSTGVNSTNNNPASGTAYSGNIRIGSSNLRIYYFKIYDNGNLIRDYVPCFRNSDGEAGLYDLVNNEFHTNDSTTSESKFIKGKSQHFVYDTAQNLTENTYTKQGYTFNGWNTKPDGTGTSYTDGQEVNNLATSGDVTLYAQWNVNSYHVTYVDVNILTENQIQTNIAATGDSITNNNGVYTISKSSAYTGLYIPASTFEKGKTYALRYQVQKTAGTLQNIGGHAAITTQKSFTIDGENSVNTYDQPHKGNGNISNDTNVHTIEFVFTYIGNHNNTMDVYIQPNRAKTDSVIVKISNIALYEVVDEATYTYGQTLGTLPTKTKTGYMFNGWFTEPNGGTKVTEETTIAAHDAVYYAQWTSNQYSVKFNPNISSSSLPSGYQQLEYIESDGNEYINSGYKPTMNTGIEATFQFTDSTTAQQRLYGVGSDTSADGLLVYEFYINGTNNFAYAFKNNLNGWTSTGIKADTNKHTLSFNTKNDKAFFVSNSTQVNISKISTTATMTSSNYNLFILGRNYYYNSSTHPQSYGKIKLYSFKIYEDSVIQKNFVPCYEISSGKAGLYDTIGNEFYPSSRENYELLRDGKTYSQDFSYGTAQNLSANTFTREGYEFVGWNTAADGTGTSYSNEQNVNNLVSTNDGELNLYAIWNQNSYTVDYYPNRVSSEYKEVEYIESTGSQYIDTGYNITGTTGVEAEYEYTSLTTQQRIFGTDYYQLYINRAGNYGYLFNDNTSDWKTNNIRVDKGKHKVEFNKELGRLKFDDGNLYNNASLLSGLTNTSANTLSIMSAHGGGNKAKIKIYSFKIYENERLVRNYIPCYKVSDNTIGMYETINQEFHPSVGTGMLKGEDAKNSQIITIGQSQNLIANPYTNEYYTFNGWNTSQDGTGTSYTNEQAVSLSNTPGDTISLYAKWEEKAANFDGNGSTSKLEDVTELTNITRFEKYNGSNSNVQTLINNGTAVKIDDNTTEYSIYAWYDNGTVYWWSDVNKVYLLDKSHYLWSQLTNAEYIDTTGVDTSKLTVMNGMFKSAGYDASTFQIVGLDKFNTSNVTAMSSVFDATGYNATSFDIGNIGSWDTSNVTIMSYLFSSAGYNATTFNIGDLSNWKVSKVTSFSGTFLRAGFKATTFNIGNLGNWRFNTVSNVNMYGMFFAAGYSATTWYIGDLSGWNVEKVTSFNGTFNNAGYNATTFNIGNLSNWRFNTTTNISMQNMFNGAGRHSTTWYIGDISNWNVEKVTSFNNTFSAAGYTATTVNIGDLSGWRFNTTTNINMQGMFGSFGYNATVFNLGNLDSWNVEKVSTFNSMFSGAGRNATTWNIGDLSNWNTSNATSIAGMFSSAGYMASSVSIGDLSAWNTGNVTAMNTMFSNFAYSANTFNIGNIGRWNVSKVTTFNSMFESAGRNATTWYIGDLSGWTINTLNDVTMASMFRYAGYSSTNNFNIGNIGLWNVSKVTTFSFMFSYAGYDSATWNIGDLSNWQTGSSTTMSGMFNFACYSAAAVSIGDLSAWNTGNVTNMSSMFSNFAYSANTFNIGNIGSWNVSKVTSFNTMFSSSGRLSTTWNIGDLSNWVLNTTENIDMASMFSLAAYSASAFDIGNIGRWNVSKVTTMSLMFNNAGRNATTWNIGDLSNWDVSNVTNMYYLFNSAAYSASTFNIGDLSNWNTSNVTHMASMFHYTGRSATTWGNIGTLKVYASNIENLFYDCNSVKGTINIYSNPTAYTNAFAKSSTVSGAGIVVNYSSSTTNIDRIIATKTASDNVTKGSQLD